MANMDSIIQQLDETGFYRFHQVFDADRVKETLQRIRDCYEEGKDNCSDKVPFLNIGQPTVYNLQNKDYYFLKLLFEPPVLQELLCHFLNDRWFKQIPQEEPNYILRSFIARSSNNELPMHLDSFIPYLGEHVFIMQLSIILEDQNAENGCTVVVPGSHRSGEYATQEAFADAISIESKAGDIVLWDSRLWHGTRANHTDKTRWAIIATFGRWWLKQQWDIPRKLPDTIYQQLTDSQKAVLGFCSAPYDDEMAGIDMKRGYSDLPGSLHDGR